MRFTHLLLGCSVVCATLGVATPGIAQNAAAEPTLTIAPPATPTLPPRAIRPMGDPEAALPRPTPPAPIAEPRPDAHWHDGELGPDGHRYQGDWHRGYFGPDGRVYNGAYGGGWSAPGEALVIIAPTAPADGQSWRSAWLDECHRRFAAPDAANFGPTDALCNGWLSYYERGGYTNPGYGYAIPVMMVPVAEPRRAEVTKVVTEEWIDAPVHHHRVKHPRPVVHDKRIRLIPDKRVHATPDKRTKAR